MFKYGFSMRKSARNYRMWSRLADEMEACDMSARCMERLMRKAERCARRDGGCLYCTLYGNYLEQDYAEEEAWKKAVSYMRYASDRMNPVRWARLAQMMEVAWIYEHGYDCL